MNLKNHGRKWLYYFALGVAIIIVYKALDNFNDVMGGITRFFDIITPFLVGIFISYLLYMPCRKMEEAYRKSKWKFLVKRARGLAILTVYLILVLLFVILINFILPVVFESVIDLVNNIQSYYEIAISNYNNLSEDNILKSDVVNDMIQTVQNLDIKQYFQLEKILAYVVSAIDAVTGVFDVVVALIVSVYILSRKKRNYQSH